jgi:hypothetical protein
MNSGVARLSHGYVQPLELLVRASDYELPCLGSIDDFEAKQHRLDLTTAKLKHVVQTGGDRQ